MTDGETELDAGWEDAKEGEQRGTAGRAAGLLSGLLGGANSAFSPGPVLCRRKRNFLLREKSQPRHPWTKGPIVYLLPPTQEE